MARPNRLSDFLQVTEETIVVGALHAGVTFVERVVHRFDIEEDEVGSGSGTARSLRPNRPCGVERGVQPFCTAEVEEGFDKLGLEERFASGAGDPSAADEVLIFPHFGHQLFGGEVELVLALDVPRVGIVAKEAAHGASLQKSHKTDAGAIDGAHRLHRVQAADEGSGRRFGRRNGSSGIAVRRKRHGKAVVMSEKNIPPPALP